jgi:exonuclease III
MRTASEMLPAEPERELRAPGTTPDVLLLCWNVAGKRRRVPEQLEKVAALAVDVVCLQEVIGSAAEAWVRGLQDAGWPHAAVGDPRPALADGRTRPRMTLTAAKTEFELVAVDGLPWPERVLATRHGELEIVNVHSPVSPSPGLAKVLTHEAVHAHLAAGSGPRLACGDLNTPRKEHPDGRVWTFARDRYGRLRADRGERWDAAELAVLRGLEEHGFRDAFRALYGLERRELSWEWPRWGGGYRLDHLIASGDVEVLELSYLHEWRRDGLSDHSALQARIEVASRR